MEKIAVNLYNYPEKNIARKGWVAEVLQDINIYITTMTLHESLGKL